MPNYTEHSRRLEQVYPYQGNTSMRLLNKRMGNNELPTYYPDTVEAANHLSKALIARGGFPQQDRMIKDKRRSLDYATKHSYQAALVRKVQPLEKESIILPDGTAHGPFPDAPVRALINPDKNKMNYDDKIISIGYEHDYKPGDVFEWCNTKTFWLVYLQDLEELAYFRGEIRRCDHQIHWLDEDGNKISTYAAVRGPVETKIDYIQKHGISVDKPNLSLNILIPRNEQTMRQFQRYAKFYLKTADHPTDDICWRVEAVDTISAIGVIELSAVEYYANEFTDDVQEGLVDAFVEKIESPKQEFETYYIEGPSSIKPKGEYEYHIAAVGLKGRWHVYRPPGAPIRTTTFESELGYPTIRIKWDGVYSGQFDIAFFDENENKEYRKTVIIQTLF